MEEMLSKRLSKNESIHVITLKDDQLSERLDPADRKTVIKTASELSADYLLTGSLTIFGNSISTEAEFIDTVTGKVLLRFSEISKNRDDVFEHLKLLADRINKEVLSPVPADQNRIEAEPVIEKPEKMPPPEKGKSMPSLSWKSQYFQIRINSLSSGNVDGEIGEDVIFSSEKKLFIYRYINQNLVKFREIETPSRTRIIHVDAADINQNGKDEIFVTAMNLMTRSPDSFILEWDGNKFQKNTENEEWYFNVLHMPAGKDILLGQKQGRKHPFLPGVYELAWKNNKYISTRKYQMPDTINIYEFTYGDLLADGKQERIIFDNRDRLIMFHPDGETLWSGSEKYGGSETYLEYPTAYDDPRGDSTDHYYLQQRLHVTPCQENKNNCLVVVKNNDRAGRYFSRLRSFASGHVECLAWNGVGLEEKWRTPDVAGYISDSVIGDLDNDGKNELVFAVIMDEGLFFKKKKSFISAWKIQN
jgi:TolB-like protein